jgi:hypothetical protein
MEDLLRAAQNAAGSGAIDAATHSEIERLLRASAAKLAPGDRSSRLEPVSTQATVAWTPPPRALPNPNSVCLSPAVRLRAGVLYTNSKSVGRVLREGSLNLQQLLDLGFSISELYDLGFTADFVRGSLTSSVVTHKVLCVGDLARLFDVRVGCDASCASMLTQTPLLNFAGTANDTHDYSDAGFSAHTLLALDGERPRATVIVRVLSAAAWQKLGLTVEQLVGAKFSRGLATVPGWSYQEIVAAFRPTNTQLLQLDLALHLS